MLRLAKPVYFRGYDPPQDFEQCSLVTTEWRCGHIATEPNPM
jgi:hypothetical protein